MTAVGAYGGARTPPSQLSRYLRTGSDGDLRRRRAVIGLSLLGLAMGQVVSAYQTGLIKHLPDPPVGPFDSDRVDASDYGFSRASTPDGLIMIDTYAATAWLAGAGGQDRHRHRPLLPLLLAAKVAADFATNYRLAGEEWRENRARCTYCQTASLASTLSLPLVVPEARRALTTLLRRRRG